MSAHSASLELSETASWVDWVGLEANYIRQRSPSQPSPHGKSLQRSVESIKQSNGNQDEFQRTFSSVGSISQLHTLREPTENRAWVATKNGAFHSLRADAVPSPSSPYKTSDAAGTNPKSPRILPQSSWLPNPQSPRVPDSKSPRLAPQLAQSQCSPTLNPSLPLEYESYLTVEQSTRSVPQGEPASPIRKPHAHQSARTIEDTVSSHGQPASHDAMDEMQPGSERQTRRASGSEEYHSTVRGNRLSWAHSPPTIEVPAGHEDRAPARINYHDAGSDDRYREPKQADGPAAHLPIPPAAAGVADPSRLPPPLARTSPKRGTSPSLSQKFAFAPVQAHVAPVPTQDDSFAAQADMVAHLREALQHHFPILAQHNATPQNIPPQVPHVATARDDNAPNLPAQPQERDSAPSRGPRGDFPPPYPPRERLSGYRSRDVTPTRYDYAYPLQVGGYPHPQYAYYPGAEYYPPYAYYPSHPMCPPEFPAVASARDGSPALPPRRPSRSPREQSPTTQPRPADADVPVAYPHAPAAAAHPQLPTVATNPITHPPPAAAANAGYPLQAPAIASNASYPPQPPAVASNAGYPMPPPVVTPNAGYPPPSPAVAPNTASGPSEVATASIATPVPTFGPDGNSTHSRNPPVCPTHGKEIRYFHAGRQTFHCDFCRLDCHATEVSRLQPIKEAFWDHLHGIEELLPELEAKKQTLMFHKATAEQCVDDVKARVADSERDARAEFEDLMDHLRSVESVKLAILSEDRHQFLQSIKDISTLQETVKTAKRAHSVAEITAFLKRTKDLRLSGETFLSKPVKNVHVSLDDVRFEVRERTQKLREYAVQRDLLEWKNEAMWAMHQELRSYRKESDEIRQVIQHLENYLQMATRALAHKCSYCGLSFDAQNANSRCAIPDYGRGDGAHFWVTTSQTEAVPQRPDRGVSPVSARPSDTVPGYRGVRQPTIDVDALLHRVAHTCAERGVHLRDAFAAFDFNNDGLLSKNEFAEAIHRLRLNLDDRDTNAMFQRLDTNSDGVVSYEEFIEQLPNRQMNTEQIRDLLQTVGRQIRAKGVRVADAFSLFDHDSDGILSRDAFQQAVKAMQIPVRDSDYACLLAVLDPHKTNRLRIENFVEKMG